MTTHDVADDVLAKAERGELGLQTRNKTRRSGSDGSDDVGQEDDDRGGDHDGNDESQRLKGYFLRARTRNSSGKADECSVPGTTATGEE